jgi:hypothetical protein
MWHQMTIGLLVIEALKLYIVSCYVFVIFPVANVLPKWARNIYI